MHSFPLLTRCMAILSDILVLIITWMKAGDMRRATMRLTNFRPKLSLLLMRDDTLYLVALFVLDTVTLLLDALVASDTGSDFITVNEGVASALIAMFILDLRSAFVPDHIAPIDHMSIIRFTSSFVGNMAAPLGPNFTFHSPSQSSSVLNPRVKHASYCTYAWQTVPRRMRWRRAVLAGRKRVLKTREEQGSEERETSGDDFLANDNVLDAPP